MKRVIWLVGDEEEQEIKIEIELASVLNIYTIFNVNI